MSRILTIDIGAGTMDLLCWDARTNEHFKAVAPSPVRHIARQIEATRGPLLVTGVEMGGGPVTEALRRRAQTDPVVISAAAAATLHHDPERVRDWGITLADARQIATLQGDSAYTAVTLRDVQPERIARIIQGLGLPAGFDIVALCAQDHGVAPAGTSHLDFRHHLFQTMLERQPEPHALLFGSQEIPNTFNRLRAMADSAKALGAGEIFVMDSGMAAMAGAAQDHQAADRSPVVILDIATSHTVVAALAGDRTAGFVEYHTRDITMSRIEGLIRELADGDVSHEQILAEGGHGAYLREAVGFANVQAIIATGPKRSLMAGSRLPLVWGAPWGDNMMTGTVGLLEAVRRRIGLAPMKYL
ncbi:MAG: pyruvate formate-lyase activating enzyme [Desulfatitalea sp.]|nr:DUF1786 domain-containing protein [Desulfatitalea sp.]NNJ99883.1 pyruvate formate-lyase activating enzyme [Desulfatitalea sp.]